MPVGQGFGVAFPQEEYDERLAAVRKGMAGRGADVLLLFSPTNIFYLTGYNTVSPWAGRALRGRAPSPTSEREDSEGLR